MRFARLTLLTVAVVLAAASCTSAPAELEDSGAPRLSGALTSFDSCDEALEEMKDAAVEHLSETAVEGTAEVAPGQAQQDKGEDDGGHSETNVHEKGVDEPDIVKNDGERILVLRNGELVVLDADSRKVAGSVTISDSGGDQRYVGGGQLLLRGERALVIWPEGAGTFEEGTDRDELYPQAKTVFKLIDLSSGKPEAVSSYQIDGSYVDAREVDGVARVVVRSAPDIEVPEPGPLEDEQDARLKAVENSTIKDWTPKYEVDGHSGQVPCDAMARPADYSGTSTLTILSFDVNDKLDDGSPVSLKADGEIVYGSGDSLYVANDRQDFTAQSGRSGGKAETEIFRFALGERLSPDYRGAASVPGYVLNQYALSEWDGHLRVATTEGISGQDSSSSVYVLKVGKRDMERVAEVNDLGPGEKIEGVRFNGDTGYVVTFEQTDPLYTLDLSDPGKPEETGELKITGYSAYLHPVDDERLIGVGPAGDAGGNLTGLQVSLFDVGDPAAPDRQDSHEVAGGSSAVESDPHAFLYWPDAKRMFLPVNANDGSELLALELDGDELKESGSVTHDGAGVLRALVVDGFLWTVSDAGVKVSGLDDLKTKEWIEFDKE